MKLFLLVSLGLLAHLPLAMGKDSISQTIHETIGSLLDRYPSMAAMQGILFPRDIHHDTSDPEKRGFSQEERDSLKKIFKKDSLLEDLDFSKLLRGAKMPNMKNLQEASVASFIERMYNDPSLAQYLMDQILVYIEQRHGREAMREQWMNMAFDEDDDEAQYQQCRIDYAGFVEPITIPILHVVWEIICDIICEELGPILCNQCRNFELPEPGEMPPYGGRMIDAMAKIPEGIFEGRLHWQGAYEYCEEFEVEYEYNTTTGEQTLREFDGQYCRLDLTPTPDEDTFENETSITLSLQFGVCVPSTCEKHHVYRYIAEDNLVLRVVLELVMGMNITYVYCGRDLDSSSDPRFQAAVGIILTLAVIVIIASIWDGCPCIRKKWVAKKIKKLGPGSVNVNFDPFAKGGSPPSPSTPIDTKLGLDPTPPTYDNVMHAYSSIDEPLSGDKLSSSIGGRQQSAYLSQTSVTSTNTLITTVSNHYEQMKISFLERVEMVLTGFSAYSNSVRIMRCRDDSECEIPVLNAIRVMSFGWVLWGHTWLFGPVYFECWVPSNLLSAVQRFPKQWDFQLILNFHFNSDAFFLISGVLLTYWWLRKHENTNRVTFGQVVYHIVHKYWRLMPAIMLAMMFYSCLYRYLGDGPFFPEYVQDAENCRTNWWPNLLMVNNYVNTHKTCLTWLWYPPILFQLHVVSLVILVPLVIKPKAGYLLLAAMFVAHIGATAGITDKIYDDDESLSWYWDYFVTPWCRAGPYIIGMALGIVLHKVRGSKVKMHWLVALLSWIVALTLVLLPLYITHDQFKEGGEPWSQSEDVAYDTLARNSFALGLAWIVFACHVGYGGVINSLLQYKFWWPLSKLVFVAYTTHSMIIFALAYGRMTPLYINEYQQTYRVLGHFWMCIGVGYVWAILWQYPLSVGFERAILAKTKLDWIRCGRHPGEELKRNRNARDITNFGVVSGPSTFTSGYNGSVNTEKVNGGYEPEKDMKENGELNINGELYINTQTSTTPI